MSLDTLNRGDCFGWALKNAKHGDVIVHGRVVRPFTTKPIWHAWIERRDRILDFQSVVWGAGPGKKGWRKIDFLHAYKPRKMARYTKSEALACAVKTRKAGPWATCKGRR